MLLLLSVAVGSYSQKSPSKFGKVSVEELTAEYCPIDSNAHAYYLFDYGFSHFRYATTKVREGESSQNQKGFQLLFKRHFRLKILDNQGFDWADVEIPLYRDRDVEKIGTIKATTYNLENGKVVKTKLNKNDIFREETNKYWIQEKFAMPNVKEGSVIEVEYTIISDFFFNLREWEFQGTIPVMFSEYLVHIPEYYVFNQTHRGYFPIHSEEGSARREIAITYVENTNSMTKVKESTTSKIQYRDNTYHYQAKEVPAFPFEKYLRTEDNYLTKIEFELQKTDFPGRIARYYTTTWKKVDETLVKSTSFGNAINRSGHLKEAVMLMRSTEAEGLPLVNLAYNYIQKNLVWNGINTKYASNSLAKAYKDGKGNCADVNLNLVALLRDLGLESYPVVLSTQANGIIHPSHPSLSRFNYVIAIVKVENETYLLDATDPYGEINMLPVRCLNDKGRVIGSPELEWISLMDYRPYHFVSNYALTFSDDLTLSGSRKLVLKDYASYQYKKRIKSYDDVTEFAESLDEQYQEASVINLQVEGLDSMECDLTLTYDVTQNDYVEDANDIIYFPTVFDPFFDSNPFRLEKRDYPVEFNYPYVIQQNTFINLPKDYVVSELPKPLVIKMPDNSAKYIFQVIKSGDGLFVTTHFLINKSLYLPEEYEIIKQFYQVVIDKQNELIVLNKS